MNPTSPTPVPGADSQGAASNPTPAAPDPPDHLPVPRSFAIALLALVGVGVGTGLLFARWGDPGSLSWPVPDKSPAREVADRLHLTTPEQRAAHFLTFGPGAMWAFLLILQFAIWCCVIGWGLLVLIAARKDAWAAVTGWRRWDWEGIMLAVIFGALFFGPFFVSAVTRVESPINQYSPVLGFGDKSVVTYLAGFGACLTFLVAVRRIDRDAARPNLNLVQVAELVRELRLPLVGLGVMVSLAALGGAALRTGLNQYHAQTILSIESVLAYGLFYTVCLAALYLPIHLRVVAAAEEAVNAKYPGEPETDPDVFKKREDALKRIGVGPWEGTFRSAVLVLSPLLSTVVALVMPTK